MGVSFRVSRVGKRYQHVPKEQKVKDNDDPIEVLAPDIQEAGPSARKTQDELVGIRDHITDSQDLEASFTVNLFADGFSIGKADEELRLPLVEGVPKLLHPYDKAAMELISAIEYGLLPPDIFDDIPCKYVDGTVACEVRDYRVCLTKSGETVHSRERSPIVHKVRLKMCMENVIRDIAAISDNSWTYQDLLEAEARVVKLLQPKLCLDPTPRLDKLCESPVSKKLDLGIFANRAKGKETMTSTTNPMSSNQPREKNISNSEVLDRVSQSCLTTEESVPCVQQAATTIYQNKQQNTIAKKDVPKESPGTSESNCHASVNKPMVGQGFPNEVLHGVTSQQAVTTIYQNKQQITIAEKVVPKESPGISESNRHAAVCRPLVGHDIFNNQVLDRVTSQSYLAMGDGHDQQAVATMYKNKQQNTFAEKDVLEESLGILESNCRAEVGCQSSFLTTKAVPSNLISLPDQGLNGVASNPETTCSSLSGKNDGLAAQLTSWPNTKIPKQQAVEIVEVEQELSRKRNNRGNQLTTDPSVYAMSNSTADQLTTWANSNIPKQEPVEMIQGHLMHSGKRGSLTTHFPTWGSTKRLKEEPLDLGQATPGLSSNQMDTILRNDIQTQMALLLQQHQDTQMVHARFGSNFSLNGNLPSITGMSQQFRAKEEPNDYDPLNMSNMKTNSSFSQQVHIKREQFNQSEIDQLPLDARSHLLPSVQGGQVDQNLRREDSTKKRRSTQVPRGPARDLSRSGESSSFSMGISQGTSTPRVSAKSVAAKSSRVSQQKGNQTTVSARQKSNSLSKSVSRVGPSSSLINVTDSYVANSPAIPAHPYVNGVGPSSSLINVTDPYVANSHAIPIHSNVSGIRPSSSLINVTDLANSHAIPVHPNVSGVEPSSSLINVTDPYVANSHAIPVHPNVSNVSEVGPSSSLINVTDPYVANSHAIPVHPNVSGVEPSSSLINVTDPYVANSHAIPVHPNVSGVGPSSSLINVTDPYVANSHAIPVHPNVSGVGPSSSLINVTDPYVANSHAIPVHPNVSGVGPSSRLINVTDPYVANGPSIPLYSHVSSFGNVNGAYVTNSPIFLHPSPCEAESTADLILENFMKIDAVTQRHGINSEMHKIVENFERKPLLDVEPLVAAQLSKSVDTEEVRDINTVKTSMSQSFLGGSLNICKTRVLTFICPRRIYKDDGLPSVVNETQKLIMSEKSQDRTVEVFIQCADEENDALPCQQYFVKSLPNTRFADLYADQFVEQMRREGNQLIDEEITPHVPQSASVSSNQEASVATTSKLPPLMLTSNQSPNVLGSSSSSSSTINPHKFPFQNALASSPKPHQMEGAAHLSLNQHPQFQRPSLVGNSSNPLGNLGTSSSNQLMSNAANLDLMLHQQRQHNLIMSNNMMRGLREEAGLRIQNTGVGNLAGRRDMSNFPGMSSLTSAPTGSYIRPGIVGNFNNPATQAAAVADPRLANSLGMGMPGGMSFPGNLVGGMSGNNFINGDLLSGQATNRGGMGQFQNAPLGSPNVSAMNFNMTYQQIKQQRIQQQLLEHQRIQQQYRLQQDLNQTPLQQSQVSLFGQGLSAAPSQQMMVNTQQQSYGATPRQQANAFGMMRGPGNPQMTSQGNGPILID